MKPGDESLASVVRRGLTHEPKFLSSRFIYDAAGSTLFEEICEQPEYYLTRTEDAILRDHAEEMVSGWDEVPVMIELGSGSSTKTRRLIEAALEAYGSLHYVPIDVSESILEESARTLVADYPELTVTGFAADYDTVLWALSDRFAGPKLVVFLGSSLGNFDDEDAISLLKNLSQTLGEEDRFLIGFDLVKNSATLEAAYDDAAGVSAQFSKNILTRINRELSANFNLDHFDYQARFVPEHHRVEMRLVSNREQQVKLPGVDLVVKFAEGESIHVENSHKYTTELLENLANRSEFVQESSWTDSDERFRVQRWQAKG